MPSGTDDALKALTEQAAAALGPIAAILVEQAAETGASFAQVRREVAAGATLLFELDGPHLAYAVGINAQRYIAMVRRLIERRVPVDANELADATKPLAQMLKAKA